MPWLGTWNSTSKFKTKMPSSSKTSILSLLLACTLTALATGAGAWFSFGVNKVSREEMVQYVQESAPWVKEKGEILAHQQANTKDVAQLASSVQSLVQAQATMTTELKLLIQKVELYLDSDRQ